jgi:hypothetical protein
VVITKDRSIRRTPLERAVVLTHRVLYFSLTGGNMTGEEMVIAILAALPAINRIVAGAAGRGAVMARISATDDVAILEARG